MALPLTRTSVPTGASRMKWIAEAVKRDALGWLVRQGGWRSIPVVVGGRRCEGRVWTKAIFSRLAVRFTPGPLHLLVAAMETQGPVPKLPKQTQSALREGVQGADPATGDLLALHRIVSSLQAASGGEDFEHLRSFSPLTLAFELEAAGTLDGGSAAVQDALAPLFRGDRATLLSYLDQALASAWLDQEAQRRRLSPQDSLLSYAAAVRGFEGFVRAATSRPDALRPIISFYVGYVLRRFGGRAPVFEALTQKSQGFDRASERQEFLRTAGALFSFGQIVTAAADEALAAPFVDRSEEQKVLLADYHDRFKDVAGEVEAIRRELVGEIG